jgi:hypothetical protein
MWTEYLRGQSLAAYLDSHGPLSAREATLIGLDLCRALSAVHGAGLVHRDVKPSNVMRAEGGRIVLMDFGSVAELRRSRPLDATRNIQGTPVTMAPEQLRGEVAGAATDIYGLGVLLYYLVSGRYPAEAQTLPELIRCHERREYVPLRDRRADLPLAFVQVVERALLPDPECRYASAGAMEHALNATLVAEIGGFKSWLRENRGVLLAASILIAAVIGLGAIFFGGGRGTEEDSSGLATGQQPVPPLPGGGGGAPPNPGGPAPLRALTATVSLQRLVDSVEAPVPPGSRVRLGDRLALEVKPGERANFYVLNADEEGNVYLLFPLPGLDPGNPLDADRTYHLPGSDAPDSTFYWTVTNAGVQETIVAIAARAPLPDIERAIQAFPKAERGRPVLAHPLPTEALRHLRGIGGLTPAPKRRSDEVHHLINDMLRNLEARRDSTGDVWIWKTELKNPAPRT